MSGAQAGPVVCDLRAIQSPDYRGRGVGRWSYELAAALERRRPELVAAYLLDPRWSPPGAVEALLESGKLVYSGTKQAAAAVSAARVFHAFSPFEPTCDIGELRPQYVDRQGLFFSATAYDLIPLQAPEVYLADLVERRRYEAHLQLLTSSDAIFCISAAVAKDIVSQLGISPSRCHVVGTGVSPVFSSQPTRLGALDAARTMLEGLDAPFVLFPGGNEPRKNAEGLLVAFGALEPDLLTRHRLVVTGELPPLTTNHYRHLAAVHGYEDRLVLAGFVPDEVLAWLYRAAELVVLPSLAEGYGLPVAEALSCGTAVAVSDRPPLDELVPEQTARFDPTDTKDMAATLNRLLGDHRLRQAVVSEGQRRVSSWDDVAEETAAVFEDLARRPARPWRKRRRLAVISPFPPLSSGVADYSARLVAALSDRDRETSPAAALEIDCFADGLDRHHVPPAELERAGLRDARNFLQVDAVTGGYDQILYVLGNSEVHTGALVALRERPGVVLAHDVRLSGLFVHSTERPGAVPGGIPGAIARAYGGKVPAELGADNSISRAAQDLYGLLFIREVAVHSERLLVTSEAAGALATLELGPDLSERLGVLPFVMSRFGETDLRSLEASSLKSKLRPLIASFGIVDEAKRPRVLIEALAIATRAGTEADLAVVGPISQENSDKLEQLARQLGIAHLVHLTGAVSRQEYLDWLGRSDVAVQLRERFFGEASGTVSECMSAGLPTVVSRVGWMAELPDTVAAKVAPSCGPSELATVLTELLGDENRRRALGQQAKQFVQPRTFAASAAVLFEELGL
jgi:glycosyltransferase involved in cell wall biosynthesis